MADVSTDTTAPAVASEPTADSSNPTLNGAPNNKDSLTKDAANGQSKKDRKPRRQGLPLPDPIPETPVKRYPEPSKTDMQAKVDAEDAKIQACFDRLNATRDFYNQRQKIREECRPAFDDARKLLVDLNEQTRTLFDERKALSARLKDIREADVAARGGGGKGSGFDIPGVGKDGNEALKGVSTIEQLEAKIKELQYRHETESMPMQDEKRIVAQISFLTHKGRDIIRERDQVVKNEKAAKEARITNRKELEDARSKLDTRIDAAKAKLDAQRKIVDDIRLKQDEEVKKLEQNTDTIDRDAEKKTIADLKGKIRKIRDDFQTELDKWYLNERIHYEQQKIAKRKKYEAMQAEREARRKAWEAEQAQYPEPHPYQQEKDLCSGLIVYLQTLLGETVEKPSVNLRGESNAPSLKSNGNVREVSVKGKAIGKSNDSNDAAFGDLLFGDFVKKSAKKGKKGRRATATSTSAEPGADEEAALKPHSIDYLTAFTKLEIKAPKKMSEVRTALEEVRSKLTFFETAPAPTEEEKAEKAKKTDSKPKKQSVQPSEKTNGVNLLNGDGNETSFPGLGAAAPSPARDESLPSFKAVASGAASAPMAAPPMASEMPGLGEVADIGDGQTIVTPETDAVAVGAEDEGIVPPQPEPRMTEA